MAGNPRVDEDMHFFVPVPMLHKDRETGAEVAITQMPVTSSTVVSDPTAPGGKRRVTLPMTNRVIMPATEYHRRRFLAEHSCITCIHFDQIAGQREIKRQKVFERIVHEHNWKWGWFGVGPETYGLCGDSGGTTLVPPVGGCENWKDGRGKYRFLAGLKKKATETVERVFAPTRER